MLPQNRPISCRCPAANRCSLGREPGGTTGWIHGLGYLCSAFRREGLISDELSLQLLTFLRSLDLLLELRVRPVPPRSLTPKQPRRGGKQGTDGPELSCFHSSIPSIHETIGGRGHETIVPWLTNWPPPLNQGGLSIKDGQLRCDLAIPMKLPRAP